MPKDIPIRVQAVKPRILPVTAHAAQHIVAVFGQQGVTASAFCKHGYASVLYRGIYVSGPNDFALRVDFKKLKILVSRLDTVCIQDNVTVSNEKEITGFVFHDFNAPLSDAGVAVGECKRLNLTHCQGN